MPEITIPARYCRLYWDDGVPHREEHFTLVEQRWTMKTDECALVLVDCWDKHYIDSHLERTNQITLERIAPAIQACRRAGIAVVHAPSPPTARKYPQWVAYAGDSEFGPSPAGSPPDWPPEAFRKKEGDYAQFAKPVEEGVEEWRKTEGEERLIVGDIAPQPGDFVIATGEQLHRLLRDRKVIHLLYAGFAANMCVPGRDYGTRAMQGRGYNIILLRDCTTAIEGAETAKGGWLTKAAILNHEMIVGHTTTSAALVAACEAVG
jgi:nicotinamidase-related amidase